MALRVHLDWSGAASSSLIGIEGVDIPTPDVADWLQPVWRCWHRLNLDRPWHGGGMGAVSPGRIPWRDVLAWSEFHGHSPETFEFLDRCIRIMDGTYLQWFEERRPK